MENKLKRARTKERRLVWVLLKAETNGSLNENGIGTFDEMWLGSDCTLNTEPRRIADDLSVGCETRRPVI